MDWIMINYGYFHIYIFFLFSTYEYGYLLRIVNLIPIFAKKIRKDMVKNTIWIL